MVTVKATGGGEIVGIRIDPKAIDPDDPEMLADMVLAAVNEALRSAQRAGRVEDAGPMLDLGALGLARPAQRDLAETAGCSAAGRTRPRPRHEAVRSGR